MAEQFPSNVRVKQDCTCGETCERKGRAFPDDWSWRCRLLPYMQPHPESRASGWRCFHCGDLFVVEIDARNHFGATQDAEPACKIKMAGEFALLTALRNAEELLASRQSDDTDTIRAMHSMQADHATALRREEERGFARGVADVKAHPESVGLMPIPENEPPAVAGTDEYARREQLADRLSWPQPTRSDLDAAADLIRRYALTSPPRESKNDPQLTEIDRIAHDTSYAAEDRIERIQALLAGAGQPPSASQCTGEHDLVEANSGVHCRACGFEDWNPQYLASALDDIADLGVGACLMEDDIARIRGAAGLLVARAGPIPPSPWQPIETAPNGQSIFVVYDNGDMQFIHATDNDYEWMAYDGYVGPGIVKPIFWGSVPAVPVLTKSAVQP